MALEDIDIILIIHEYPDRCGEVVLVPKNIIFFELPLKLVEFDLRVMLTLIKFVLSGKLMTIR